MSRGNKNGKSPPVIIGFSIFAALLLCYAIWDFSASYTENRVNADYNASRYASEAREIIEQDCLPATYECVLQIVEATHEHERTEHDLAAQRDMAKWALGVLIVSAIGTGVGGFGLILIYRTLTATRKGNKINREIGEKQIRAYVAICDVRLRGDDQGNFNRLSVSYKNYGQTPALSVSTSGALTLDTEGSGGTPYCAAPKVSGFPVAPGQERFSIIPFSDAHIAFVRAAQNGIPLFAHGEITYRDVFKKERVTSFKGKFLFDATDKSKYRFSISPDGNEAT